MSRVIIGNVEGSRLVSGSANGPTTPVLNDHFVACEIEGYGGDHVLLRTPGCGTHMFSREDGRWLAGPTLNYKDHRIIDEDLDAPIRDGANVWALRPATAQALNAPLAARAS